MADSTDRQLDVMADLWSRGPSAVILRAQDGFDSPRLAPSRISEPQAGAATVSMLASGEAEQLRLLSADADRALLRSRIVTAPRWRLPATWQ
jgi:hypothetical protein